MQVTITRSNFLLTACLKLPVSFTMIYTEFLPVSFTMLYTEFLSVSCTMLYTEFLQVSFTMLYTSFLSVSFTMLYTEFLSVFFTMLYTEFLPMSFTMLYTECLPVSFTMLHSKLYILTKLNANDVTFISVNIQKLYHFTDVIYCTVNSIFVAIKSFSTNVKNAPYISSVRYIGISVPLGRLKQHIVLGCMYR